MNSTRPLGGGQSSGIGSASGLAEKTPLTNYVGRSELAKTNHEQTNVSELNPLVAAAPHYMAQQNNWLLWLLVFLIALFLLVLEIRRRMDARARRRAKLAHAARMT